MRKFEGIDASEEISHKRVIADLRSPWRKLQDMWSLPEGQQMTLLGLFVLALLTFWLPLSGEFILLLILGFRAVMIRYKKKRLDFPIRVPVIANMLDGSTNKIGDGVMYLGSDVKTELPAYLSENDARTHALIFGTTGSGKAQPLDAKVHTPTGWRLMGDIQPGDLVSVPDGGAAPVLAVFPQGSLEIYRIVLADGRTTEACGDHLWEVNHVHWAGVNRVLSTVELAELVSGSLSQFALPIPAPIEKPFVQLPENPYQLGLRIGQGSQSDEEGDVLVKVQAIPDLYLEASIAQRQALLRGVLQGARASLNVFETDCLDLAQAVRSLVWSLGGGANIISGATHKLHIRHLNMQDLTPCALEDRTRNIAVAKVERVGAKQAKCIYVDHPKHLYVTDDYIVTHNTEFLLSFIVNSLVFDGGGALTDGKGDVKLWLKFINAARMLGRECDLLLVSFIQSGKEFYDRQYIKPCNTMNPYAIGSSSMCTEASISLMDSSKGDDMWKGRAIMFLSALIKPLVFLRDQGTILLSADMVRNFFELPILEKFVYDEQDNWPDGNKRPKGFLKETYKGTWDKVINPLRAFMITIPGYDPSPNKRGKQEQKTLEQHGYIVMQLARLFGELADNYGHIMDTPLGEVDMNDVVLNNRIFVTLLPALEKSPESLSMLGKITVGGFKQMAAGCLGNQVEGLKREIVDARPTKAKFPFPLIFDEYGYYAVLGFSSMPAQARSLGFMIVFAAQDFASLKKSSPEEADQVFENTNFKAVGRMTSGTASETYKRMSELAGTAKVAESAGFEREVGLVSTKIRASERIEIKERPRVSSDDLHSQSDGEFHIFLGKMSDGKRTGGVTVSRINGFYTDVEVKDKRAQPQAEWLLINHFARVLPPARLENEVLADRLFADMYEGNLQVRAPAGDVEAIQELNAIERLNANLGEERFSAVDLAMASAEVLMLINKHRKAKSSGNGLSQDKHNQLMDAAKAGGAVGGKQADGTILATETPQVTTVNVQADTASEINELVEGAHEAGMSTDPRDVQGAADRAEEEGELALEASPLPNEESVTNAICSVAPTDPALARSFAQGVMKTANEVAQYLNQPHPPEGYFQATALEQMLTNVSSVLSQQPLVRKQED